MRHVSRGSIPIKHFHFISVLTPQTFFLTTEAGQYGILRTKHVISPYQLPSLKWLPSLQALQRLQSSMEGLCGQAACGRSSLYA